jgi:hypothetical protein
MVFSDYKLYRSQKIGPHANAAGPSRLYELLWVVETCCFGALVCRDSACLTLDYCFSFKLEVDE